MLLMLMVTSSLLMRAAAIPASATLTTTTKRENKSAELEEGMFSCKEIVCKEIIGLYNEIYVIYI